MPTPPSLTRYPVWDRTTRWFHGINFVCVIGLVALGVAILYSSELGASDRGKILLKTVHVSIGYVFALNLLWRLVWAFVGGRFARWGAILPGGKGYAGALRAYLAGGARGEGARYLGHNPLARLAVTALLALLLIQAATGLVLAGTDLYFPPFGGWIAAWVAAPGIDPASLVPRDMRGVDETAYQAMRAFRAPFVMVHYWNFYVLCGAIALHAAAVVMTELREESGLISAMITGRKTFARKPVDLDSD